MALGIKKGIFIEIVNKGGFYKLKTIIKGEKSYQ
jgi:hypothetical protein